MAERPATSALVGCACVAAGTAVGGYLGQGTPYQPHDALARIWPFAAIPVAVLPASLQLSARWADLRVYAAVEHARQAIGEFDNRRARLRDIDRDRSLSKR